MFDFPNTMLSPDHSPLSLSDPDFLMLDNAQSKLNTGHLYYRQPHTVQIIQLVEGPPPPPRRISSVINDSSASSSSSGAYSSEYDSESSPSDDEDESVCSSYCSSDLPPEEIESPPSHKQNAESSTESYSVRMKRILAWRENFSTQMSTTLYEPSLSPPLKRKLDIEDDDDDVTSQTSKRSRSQDSQSEESESSESLGVHSCPACDAFFSTRQSLRQHGRDARANEACCVAVNYAFE